MVWTPVSRTLPQYEDGSGDPFSGAVLKAYQAGTTTNITMAIDGDGTSPQTSIALNASGYPEVSSNEVIPYLDEDYKLSLYPTQAAADSDTGAIWTIDNIGVGTSGSIFGETRCITTNTVLDTDDDKKHLIISGSPTITMPDLDVVGEGYAVSYECRSGTTSWATNGAETINGDASTTTAPGTGGFVIASGCPSLQWSMLGDKDAQLDEDNTHTADVKFSGTDHAGLKVNNLTEAQRDALTPEEGMVIIEIDSDTLQYYNGTMWVTVLSSSLTNREIFTASGTWTQPTGVTTTRVTVIGGGAGGHAGEDVGGTGAAGGNSSFVGDTTITANGGSAAPDEANAPVNDVGARPGGIGGTGGAGGDIIVEGQDGHAAHAVNAVAGAGNNLNLGGFGGATPLGLGGMPGSSGTGVLTTNIDGGDGTGFGSGGGGGVHAYTTGDLAGPGGGSGEYRHGDIVVSGNVTVTVGAGGSGGSGSGGSEGDAGNGAGGLVIVEW